MYVYIKTNQTPCSGHVGVVRGPVTTTTPGTQSGDDWNGVPSVAIPIYCEIELLLESYYCCCYYYY